LKYRFEKEEAAEFEEEDLLADSVDGKSVTDLPHSY
jgi:hypothetical protein